MSFSPPLRLALKVRMIEEGAAMKINQTSSTNKTKMPSLIRRLRVANQTAVSPMKPPTLRERRLAPRLTPVVAEGRRLDFLLAGGRGCGLGWGRGCGGGIVAGFGCAAAAAAAAAGAGRGVVRGGGAGAGADAPLRSFSIASYWRSLDARLRTTARFGYL